MDFVNKGYSQVSELFRSMTPAARITAALLLAVVVVSFAFLFNFRVSGDDEYLFGNRDFEQSELGAMEKAFAAAGLNESEIIGNKMRVPRAQKNLYLQAINDAGVMLASHGDYDQAAQKSDTMFPNRQQREYQNKAAQERELALIVTRMRDIDIATVQIDELKKGGLRSLVERTALVAVQTVGGRPLPQDRVSAIRETIAGGIAGLETTSITVTDMATGMAYRGSGADGMPLAADNPYAKHKALYENFWRDKILRRLSTIPGVNVEVNVELDPQLRNETLGNKIDAKAVAIDTRESTKETRNQTAAAGGRPGAAPNGVVSNGAASLTEAERNESSNNETTSQQRLLPSTERTVTMMAPLVPNRVTASIDVPESYFVKIWARDNPTAEGEEPAKPEELELKKIEEGVRKKIEESIVGLLPSVPLGDDPYPQVVVTTYPDMPIIPPAAATMGDKAFTWLGLNWQTLALSIFGLVSLFMFRGMLKGGGSNDGGDAADSPIELAENEGADSADGEVSTEEKKENELKRKFQKKDGNLRDDLAELVSEDPDAAASVLSKWIGDAA